MTELLSENHASHIEGSKSGRWVPLLEYSLETGVSISTLRRYIKSGKVPYRLEEGKYYLELRSDSVGEIDQNIEGARLRERDLHVELKTALWELERAHEEISELKMLVSLYEEKLGVRA